MHLLNYCTLVCKNNSSLILYNPFFYDFISIVNLHYICLLTQFPANIYLYKKSTIETLEKDVKYVQS